MPAQPYQQCQHTNFFLCWPNTTTALAVANAPPDPTSTTFRPAALLTTPPPPLPTHAVLCCAVLPRPDFLDRCAPVKVSAGNLTANYGIFTSPTCTANPNYKLKDGRYSFPSGHSSCTMAAGLFAAMYLLWSVHARDSRDVLGPHSACRNGQLCFVRWLKAELLRLVVILVALFQLAWPWGVAVSR